MSDNPSKQSFPDFAESLMQQLDDEPDWIYYDALNRVEPLGRRLKPLDELDERQRALMALHVNDMSLWRAEGKLDSNDTDQRFETYPELRELLA